MKLLDGKNALIFGIANKNSIAWGIAQALAAHGANLGFSYGLEQLERRVQPLADSLGVTFVEKCDVTDEAEVERVFARAGEQFGHLDILVHAVAYAPQAALTGRYVDTARDDFRVALDVSAYSLVALTRGAVPLMTNGGSVVTLTYYGSEKAMPHYNVMGVAKAALEASVRYMAADLGPAGIRVNAISAGPIKTLAASGIGDFRRCCTTWRSAPAAATSIGTKWATPRSGCGDLASGVTGEVVYVDAGYNILGMPEPPERWE